MTKLYSYSNLEELSHFAEVLVALDTPLNLCWGDYFCDECRVWRRLVKQSNRLGPPYWCWMRLVYDSGPIFTPGPSRFACRFFLVQDWTVFPVSKGSPRWKACLFWLVDTRTLLKYASEWLPRVIQQTHPVESLSCRMRALSVLTQNSPMKNFSMKKKRECWGTNTIWTYILLERNPIAVFSRHDFWRLDECAHAAFVDAEEVLTWAGCNPETDLKWAPDSIALICFTSGYYSYRSWRGICSPVYLMRQIRFLHYWVPDVMFTDVSG